MRVALRETVLGRRFGTLGNPAHARRGMVPNDADGRNEGNVRRRRQVRRQSKIDESSHAGDVGAKRGQGEVEGDGPGDVNDMSRLRHELLARKASVRGSLFKMECIPPRSRHRRYQDAAR
jgi:hypothetical protein